MSSTCKGRGLLAILAGRRRGLRPPSPPHVGRVLSVPQLGRGRGLRPPSLHHAGGRARARAVLQQWAANNFPCPPGIEV